LGGGERKKNAFVSGCKHGKSKKNLRELEQFGKKRLHLHSVSIFIERKYCFFFLMNLKCIDV
jgi:hypothetical protein